MARPLDIEGLVACTSREIVLHPKCGLTFDAFNGDYDCSYHTTLCCDDCKYGAGRKDPEAKCNRPEEKRNAPSG
jgi:hypothetical protein